MECNGITQKDPYVDSNKIQNSVEDFTKHVYIQSNAR